RKKYSARTVRDLCLEKPADDMNQERRPARRRFDETEAQAWKLFGNPISHQITKREQRHHPRMAEGVVAREVEHIQYLLYTTASVHADRQIVFLSFFVDRKQIRM